MPAAIFKNNGPFHRSMAKAKCCYCTSRANALKFIAALSAVGMVFSGYLSYDEVWGSAASFAPEAISGVPSWGYGFAMYALLFIAAVLGLRSKD